jgi:A/G-specific adenine glycosylase
MAEARLGENLALSLLHWYDTHGRNLPWRMKGTNQDPYQVWLSEIMLQQTTVAAVKEYYLKFIALWPSVQDLAQADREDVMRAWAGLGYYARARNLHACAKVVASELNGNFPQTIDELQKLPGIGPYTAGAVAAIAFDVPAAAVDGNVERVITRLHAIQTPLPDSKLQIRTIAQTLVPQSRAGDFAQALMDLGATICTPRSPNCLICPWTDECAARTLGIAETLPRKTPKKSIATRKGYAFWIEHQGKVLLRQRPDKGLLGGMLEVPTTEWNNILPKKYTAPIDAQWRKHPGIIEHTFTHFHLELTVLVAESPTGELLDQGNYRWVAHDQLDREALPTVMKKVAARVLQARSSQ